MFNKGRPRTHMKVGYFTYETKDGLIRTYEMSPKGKLIELHQDFYKKFKLKQLEGSEADNTQKEIQLVHPGELEEDAAESQDFAEGNSKQLTEGCNQINWDFPHQIYLEDINANSMPDVDIESDIEECINEISDTQEEKPDKSYILNLEDVDVQDFHGVHDLLILEDTIL